MAPQSRRQLGLKSSALSKPCGNGGPWDAKGALLPLSWLLLALVRLVASWALAQELGQELAPALAQVLVLALA